MYHLDTFPDPRFGEIVPILDEMIARRGAGEQNGQELMRMVSEAQT